MSCHLSNISLVLFLQGLSFCLVLLLLLGPSSYASGSGLRVLGFECLFHRLYLRNFRLGPLSLRTVHWNVTGDALPKVIWHSIHYPVLSPRICRYRDPSAIPSRMRYAWICIGFTPSLIQLATTFITRLHNRVSEQSWGGAHPLSY